MSNPKPPAAFYELLPSKSTQDLLTLLAHSEDYLPEAVTATQQELNSRGVDYEIPNLQNVEKSAQALASAKSKAAPISIPLGSFAFLWGAMFGLALMAITLSVAISVWSLRKRQFRKIRAYWILNISGVAIWGIWRFVVVSIR